MTTIEWTDKTLNPIRARLGTAVGHHCVKVSTGCSRCYASTLQPVFFGMPTFDRVAERKNVEHFLDASRFEPVLRRQKPTKWFWQDMSDLFGPWVSFHWIATCMGIMAATPRHTHQLLTKHPERAQEFFAWLQTRATTPGTTPADYCYARAREVAPGLPAQRGIPFPLPNIWLGATVENQQERRRIEPLRGCPAALRWLSMEPIREHVTLSSELLSGIHWAVVGGESGQRPRSTEVSWVRFVVEQCELYGLPCFVKQLGANVWDINSVGFDGANEMEPLAWPPGTETDDFWNDPNRRYQGAPCRILLRAKKGGDPQEWPADLRVREWPQTA